MNQLQAINHEGQRVLTTAQLAEAYGADKQIITNNFTRNKDRYKEGKHFICLTGNDLREYRAKNQFDLLPSNLNKLYLWTEKGAWMHAKSLNTDQAWDAYEMLVDDYYKVVEQQPINNLELALQAALKHEQDIKVIKSDVDYLKNNMRIDGAQEQALNDRGKAKVLEALGGIESPAYNAIGKKVFAQLWRDFKKHFCLPRYSELPKTKFNDAVYFISKWRPSTSLEIEIESCNRQGQMF